MVLYVPTITVPQPVLETAREIAEERDISVKAAFSIVFIEAGYDVTEQ